MSTEWLRNKGATINPKNKDNKCFKYVATASLNHKQIENHPERISNLKPFIDQYKWKGIEFPSHSKDWKKFEQNKNISNKSKYNHKRNNQVILLIITDDGENWHYLAVKSMSGLFRGITSNNNRD